MTEFKIEKNIPMPKKEQRSRYPFTDMEVGDSVFIEGKTPRQVPTMVRTAKLKGFKFVYQRTQDPENGASGVRVWRSE